MSRVEKEKGTKIVEISCGTLYRVKVNGRETDREDMIWDIGKADNFEAAIIKRNDAGERYFLFTGGTDPTYIGTIIGQLTYDQIVKAAQLGRETIGAVFSDEEVLCVQKNIDKGSRELVIG